MATTSTTTVSPGNVVVPLSAIVDRLQGRLSSAEIDQLLYGILSKRKTEVRPGDLITADLVNQILHDLDDLTTQIAALAGGSTTKNSHAIATFADAWKAYGALVKNGSFLPTGATTADALKAATAITAQLQDVVYAAVSGGTLAYAGGMETMLAAFRRLYDRQRDVVVMFSAPIAGIADTTEHRRFATLLNTRLEQDDASGASSLKKALDTSDLDGAMRAQDRVNSMIQTQGGDVTTGNLEVTYQGAVGNTESLVINGGPTTYRFNVANKTNRALDVDLKAEFIDKATWNSQISIVNVDGSARSHVPLSAFDPTRPDDAAAKQEIRVVVATPAANDGETGTLRLTASVPPPIDRRHSADRQLTVKSSAVPQTPGIVAWAPGTPVVSGDLSQVSEGDSVDLTFKFTFSKGTGPATRSFRFRLDVSSAAANDQFFFVEFAPSEVGLDAAASSASKKVSKAFQMADGDQRTVKATITALPGAKTKNLSFKGVAESATEGVKVESQSFTVSVV